MKEIEKLRKDLFEFKEAKINAKLSKDMDKIIEKCSNIMQFHAESDYFQDALFMTGQAFYWKQEYSKALRKFQELASIENTDLALINKLWIGKTMLQLRDFDKGYSLIEEVKKEAIEKEELEIAESALISQIRFKLYRDKFAESIGLIQDLLAITENDKLKAEVTYQLGRIYLDIGEKENALKAFSEVQNYEPTFDVEFNSLLETAKIMKDLGDIDGSLELLNKLSNDSKYDELWDKVDLEIASILKEQGDYEDALDIYIEIDSTYQRSESGGIAAFNAGLILKENFYDYDSAMFYFDRTLAANSPSEIKLQARKENKVLNDYIVLDEKLNEQYKKLSYLIDPDAFERDSLIYVEYRRQDSIKKAQARLNGRGRGRGRNYAPSNTGKQKSKIITKPIKPTISADSLRTLISDTEFEMGNLFFGELNVPDSAFYYYSSSIKNNPNTLNKPKILYAMGNYYLTIEDTVKADSLFNYIYDNYKYDRIVNEAAKKIGKPLIDFDSDPAESLYIKAEEYYLQSTFDSALVILLNIPKEYPNSQFAPQAYYTSGFILENELNNPDSAASLYDSLMAKYRNSEYSKAISKRLSFYKKEIQHKLDSIRQIQDSIKAANMPPDTTVIDSTKSKSLQDILQQHDEEVEKNKGRERPLLSALHKKYFRFEAYCREQII